MLLKFVALCLVVGTYVARCGRNGISNAPRIVGGKAAGKDAWPWQVSVQKNRYHFCGGTIIDRQWVVSAAHCFKSNSPSGYTVSVGSNSIRGTGGKSYELAKVIRHPRYKARSSENDIALLKLKSPLTYTKSIKRACFPRSDDSFDAVNCVVTGWGSIKENGGAANTLQQVTVPVISKSACYNAMKKYGTINSGHVCAGHKRGGKDSCQGDSGGPLVCKKPGRDAGWKLAGVVSWGVGCARPNVYGVYTRVSTYRNWLKQTIARN